MGFSTYVIGKVFGVSVTLYGQGVESERCASFTASLEAGKPIYTKASSTLADGKEWKG